MDFGQRFNAEALLDFRQYDIATKRHLKNVYSCMTLTVLSACIGAAFAAYFQFTGGLLLSIASIICLLALKFTGPQCTANRMALLLGFGASTGVSLYPLLNLAVSIEPSLIVTAFIGTSLIFISFTLCSLWAEKRSMLYLGGFLFSALNIMFWASILNRFIGSTFIMKMDLYLGLLVFCGFVLFDTQLIIFRFQHLKETDFLSHSVDLFLDFLNIFVRILIILMNKEDKKKSNKRR